MKDYVFRKIDKQRKLMIVDSYTERISNEQINYQEKNSKS